MRILETLGIVVELLINRAIQAEQLSLAKTLDRVAEECLKKTTVVDAVWHLFHGSLVELNLTGHVRLLERHSSGERLTLVAGRGPYYDQAQAVRRFIELSDGCSGSARAFQSNTDRIVNNTIEDEEAKGLRDAYTEETAIGMALRTVKSYAVLPIRDVQGRIIGVAQFSSSRPWHFNHARLQCLEHIRQRLGQVIGHVREKEARLQAYSNLQFLNSITPPAGAGFDLHGALRAQLEVLRTASKADVAACWLWSDYQERFVLRAGAKLERPEWVDAGWFTEGMGLTGTIVASRRAQYHPDRLKCVGEPGRYPLVLFSFGFVQSSEFTYELIGLPLWFGDQPIGTVTLYRLRRVVHQGTPSGFATTDPETLNNAAERLSAYVSAMYRADRDQWIQEELQRHTRIERELRQMIREGRIDLNNLEPVCELVRNAYTAREVRIYRFPEDQEIVSSAGRDDDSTLDCRDCDDVARKVHQSQNIVVERTPVGTAQSEPRAVRGENLIRRVSLPLSSGIQDLGVLSIRWQGSPPRQQGGTLPHHDENSLVQLTRIVSDALREAESLQREQIARQMIYALGGSLAVGFHEMKNGVQLLQIVIAQVRRDAAASVIPNHDALKSATDEIEQLKRLLDSAKRRVGPFGRHKARHCPLVPIVRNVVDESRGNSHEIDFGELDLANRSLEAVIFHLDETWIRESLKNLLQNAIRHAGVGGWVRVRMDFGPAPFRCHVTIQDSGPGMTLEKFNRLMAGQAGGSTAGGSGLGVFFAGLFINAHGGEVRLLHPGREPIFQVCFR